MTLLIAYLRLRARLAGRVLREIGWVRLALLAPVVVAAIGRVLVVAAPHPVGRWALAVGSALVLASAHRQRADFRFLTISAPRFRQWVAVEYTVAAVPVAAGLLGFGAWGAAGLTLLLAPGVAWLPPAVEARSTRQRARSPVRSEAFEWVSGLRRGGWLGWAALLAGAGWQHASPLGPVLALAGWLLVLVGCYGTPEPLSMLALAAHTPRQFLGRRLRLGLGYAALTAAPFWWLLAVGPAGPGGALAVGVAWLGLVGLVILTKYAFYPSALHIRTSQALVVGVALVMPGHPVYPVLLLVAVGGAIWQSQRRLRSLLAQPEPGIRPIFD